MGMSKPLVNDELWALVAPLLPPEPPKPAPEFSLPDLDGRPVALAELRGKVTLVFFWATW